uniref:THD domain-containing protein n=1 Tax=Mola mola TaxID=94237 RepID=A0A3Q3WVH3_MOLML
STIQGLLKRTCCCCRCCVGFLTVAMVVMTALLASIKPKSTEVSESAMRRKSNNLQNLPRESQSWQDSQSCDSCSLVQRGDSIHCTEDSLYFIYAQVTFSKHPRKNQTKSVILIRNATHGKRMKKLVEGAFPHTTESSVWVADVVNLTEADSISINITGDFLTENYQNTSLTSLYTIG